MIAGFFAPIRPLMVGDGTPLYRAEDRVEIFADFVEALYRPNTAHNAQHVAEVERKLKLYLEQPIAPIQDLYYPHLGTNPAHDSPDASA